MLKLTVDSGLDLEEAANGTFKHYPVGITFDFDFSPDDGDDDKNTTEGESTQERRTGYQPSTF